MLKKFIAILIALICLFSLNGCKHITELNSIEKVTDVYYDNETMLQNAVDALLSMDNPVIPMYINPVARGSVHYYPECEIGNLRFDGDASNDGIFKSDCQMLYETVAPLFEELNIWGIRVYRDEITFVLEYKEGFAAELFYVYDENSSFSTSRFIKSEFQIDDHWYAVKTHDPDQSP